MTDFRVASYSVSRNGMLVYADGPSGRLVSQRRIAIVGTDGTESVLNLPPRPVGGLRWAPEGPRIVFHGGEPGDDYRRGSNVYLYDTDVQNAPTRLTNRGDNWGPVFSPDGSRIVFTSVREGSDGADLFIRNLNEDAPPELLISLPGDQHPTDWPTDSLIVMGHEGAIYTVTLGGDTATYYAPDADVDDLRVAPNGALAAYASEESGDGEIYIRAFPDPGVETVVSEHPGFARSPWWSDDGGALYYRTEDTIWAAEIDVDPTPAVVSRRPLFATSGRFLHDFRGGPFLGTQSVDGRGSEKQDEPIRYVVIHDWFTELERLFDDAR